MAKLNIGMSFSGGGYRAATFHLGTLSFLSHVNGFWWHYYRT